MMRPSLDQRRQCADPEGDRGSGPRPSLFENSQKKMFFPSSIGPDLPSLHSMLGHHWHARGTPFQIQALRYTAEGYLKGKSPIVFSNAFSHPSRLSIADAR